LPPNPLFSALAASGTNIFAGGFSPSGGGVFRSDDQGNHWTVLDTGLSNVVVRRLAAVGTDIFAVLSDGRVIRSSSQGEKWTLVNTGLPPSMGVTSFAMIGAEIFAGTISRVGINGQVNGGVIRSSDQGESWADVSTGLPNLGVQALAAVGTNLYAGTPDGAFRTTNQGENWSPVKTGMIGQAVQALAAVGPNILAGISTLSNGGAFRSDNSGDSWAAINTGLPPGQSVSSFAAVGPKLFAAAPGDVFLSTDQGESWIADNAGLNGLGVRALAVAGEKLFAGTFSSGVFVADVKQ
jgi:photosystem II stability/assembly factor-like uncharacterized protein